MARPTAVTNPALAVRRTRRSTSRGFTLGECLIASVLLSLTVLGVSGSLSAASKQMDSMEIEAYCLSMAKQLSEEIAARSFDAPGSNDQAGWSSGNHQRASYDNIADYDGMLEYIDPMSSPVRVTDALEFSRRVQVEFRSTPAGPANPTGDFALIVVTVTPSAGCEPITLRRLVARTTVVR